MIFYYTARVSPTVGEPYHEVVYMSGDDVLCVAAICLSKQWATTLVELLNNAMNARLV